jgi:hypothetical protein
MDRKARYPFKRFGLLTPLSVLLTMTLGTTTLRASPIDDEQQPEPGIGMRSIGPDLIGVTRLRDPAWLNRWTREPDRMLAEKDRQQPLQAAQMQ